MENENIQAPGTRIQPETACPSFTLWIFGLILTLVVCLALKCVASYDNGVIAKKVSIAGQDVSGQTLEAAAETLAQTTAHTLDNTLELTIDGETISLTWYDLGLKFSTGSALQQAYAIGREEELWGRLLNKLQPQPTNIDLSMVWDEQTMLAALEPLNAYNRSAIDAGYIITPDHTMKILPEQPGRLIDLQALVAQIQSLDPFKEHTLEISGQPIRPERSMDDLQKQAITGLVATYTTKFDPKLINRTENIRLAAQALDQTLIEPGAPFSFNETVGPRSYDAGYQEAMIIVNGKFVPGLGGGVCQVSSTLYNVLLLADLPVTERHNHALAVSYVPLGQDATVAYPTLDLKFQNTQGYLLIKTQLAKDTLTISLYGQPRPDRQISISQNIESVIPFTTQYQPNPDLAPGQSKVIQAGQPGYIVETWRTVTSDDQTIRKESLGPSRYQSLPRIIQKSETPSPESPMSEGS